MYLLCFCEYLKIRFLILSGSHEIVEKLARLVDVERNNTQRSVIG